MRYSGIRLLDTTLGSPLRRAGEPNVLGTNFMSSVIKFSEAASLAMHTMVVLAEDPERVLSTHEIATRLGVSEAHLSKVLQRLTRAGLVESVRGPKGGFLPGKSTSEVTLLEVYECIEGPLTGKTCLLGTRVCGEGACMLGGLLATLTEQVRAYLGGAKLSGVIGGGQRGRGVKEASSPAGGEVSRT